MPMSEAQAAVGEPESPPACWALEELLSQAVTSTAFNTKVNLSVPDELTWDGQFILPEDATLILLSTMHARGYEMKDVKREDGGCHFRFVQQVFVPFPERPKEPEGPLILMRKHKRAFAILATLMLVVGGLSFLTVPSNSRITAEKIGRIRRGMSRAEVEAILGSPGDYSNGPTNPASFTGLTALPPISSPATAPKGPAAGSEAVTWLGWQDDHWMVTVLFDPSGATKLIQCIPCERQPQGFFENLGWRAERLWKRWFPK
jgi:hypothetical protein